MSVLRPFGLILLVMLVWPFLPGGLPGVPKFQTAHAANQGMTIIGDAARGWNGTNPTITIAHGNTLTLTGSSGDGQAHFFFVDTDNDDSVQDCPIDNCGPQISPQGSDTSVMSGFIPGSYSYYCSRHPWMKGSFTVTPPQSTSFALTRRSVYTPVIQGLWGYEIVSVSSLQGFSGTVTFSPPTFPAGISASLNSSSVQIAPSKNAAVFLNITSGPTTPKGVYTITLTASNSLNSQTISIPVTVLAPEFTFYQNPQMPIMLGRSDNTNLTVVSLNGFHGIVNLTATISPPGPRIHLSQNSVYSDYRKFGTAKVIVDSTGAPLGDYDVTIQGTTESTLSNSVIPLSNSTRIHVYIWQPASSVPPTGFNLPSSVLAIIGIAIIIVMAVLANWKRDMRFWRVRTTPSTQSRRCPVRFDAGYRSLASEGEALPTLSVRVLVVLDTAGEHP